jgi:hypothetical protein
MIKIEKKIMTEPRSMQQLVVPFGREGHRRVINVSEESGQAFLGPIYLFLVRRG